MWPDWEDHGLVFPSRRGTPMEPDNLRRSWGDIRGRAGLGATRFHDLRHTCVTLLLDLGAPPHVVQEIVGHSAIEVTMTISTRTCRWMRSARRWGTSERRSDDAVAVTVAVKRHRRQDSPGGLRWSVVVARGRIELPTFHFSGGFAGPVESTTVHLTGPYDALGRAGVQDRPHVSRTVVSKALARSAMRCGYAPIGGSRHNRLACSNLDNSIAWIEASGWLEVRRT